MKSEVKEIDGIVSFKPFILSITVESLEDLVEIWKRFNQSGRNVDSFNVSFKKYITGDSNITDTWKLLDNKICEYFKVKI